MTNLRHIKLLTLVLFVLLPVSSPLAAPNSFLAAARQGDTKAQYELAISYLQPGKNRPNYFEAFKWFKLAAEKGHAKAQYSLALRYLFGQGVKKNHQTAVSWLYKSAEQGFAEAQLSLGLRYYWGQGTKKNHDQARYWFEKAARQGQAKANEYLNKLQALPPSLRQQQDDVDQTRALIEDYALAILTKSDEDKNILRIKQDLEKKMTALEILKAIQLSTEQNRAELSEPERNQKFAELSKGQTTAEDYFREGNRLVNVGQLQLAVAAFEKSVQLNPRNANSLRNLASVYANIGETRKASEALKKSIGLSPGRAAKHATLGLIYHADQNLTAALTEYRSAAKLNPGIGWFYPDMADIYIQQRSYSAAWQAVRQAELLGHGKERVRTRLARRASEAEFLSGINPEIHLRQLVLESQQAAETALQMLHNGNDFGRLAKKLSLKQYRRNGGYWGQYQTELLSPQINAALKDMPPLAFSPIVETTTGFHILQKFPFFADLVAEQ
jgi:TPR repeat protein